MHKKVQARLLLVDASMVNTYKMHVFRIQLHSLHGSHFSLYHYYLVL